MLGSQQCRLGLDMRHTSALPLWSCYSPGNHLCGRTREFNGLLTLSTLLHFLPPAVFSRFFSATTLVAEQIRHYHFSHAIAPAIIYAAGRRDATGCLRSRHCRLHRLVALSLFVCFTFVCLFVCLVYIKQVLCVCVFIYGVGWVVCIVFDLKCYFVFESYALCG